MNSLDYVREEFKPYRYTLKNSATIIDSSSGKLVLKKQNKDLYNLFNYLDSRGFTNYPKVIRNFQDRDLLYEYIEDYSPFNEQKLLDLESVISSLHNKTVFFKSTNIDNYKEIRDVVLENINFLEFNYNILFKNVLYKTFLNPAEYLFARNFFHIKRAFNYCRENIHKWYDLSSSNTKERVSIVHNNLALEHFLSDTNKQALISWDNYAIDTPILDIVNLYHKEYMNYDFSEFLSKYFQHFELRENEKILFFVLIRMPLLMPNINFTVIDTGKVREVLDYVYKSEQLIRPYDTPQEQ